MKFSFSALLILFSCCCIAQKIDTVKFEVAAFDATLITQGYPPFILRITNDSYKSIKIPKQYTTGSDFYTNVNIKAEIYKNDSLLSTDGCDICFMRLQKREHRIIFSRESHLIQPSISCFNFEKGNYKVRFSLDPKSTNLFGVTRFYSFEIR